ncbi:MAG: nicotinate phosphoribosyltransferase [Oscillospiraceae bacterium]
MEKAMKIERNLTMLVDFYELTMSNGYFKNGFQNKEAVFDMFFRKIPDKGGFAISAGLEQLINYLQNLHFSNEDIEYLRGRDKFSEEFLDYLKNFKFACDVWAFTEGTPMFPGEPVVVVKGPVIQAQLIETMTLLTINYQSMVATKANRIVRAAAGRGIFEFGSRRAQSYDAAILGARAAYIGGCDATACAISDRDYGIKAVGTMAHSWVQLFDSEYEAFAEYSRLYPDDCTLLIDTYNVLKSGLPNAIKVFNEIVLPTGNRPKGVRIDSGDLAYLSKKIRKILDDAGFEDVKIIASNSLDEYIIRDLFIQGAKIDMFGVGENLITSKSDPVFGGVYKLAAVEKDGELTPKIKISETEEKITNPSFKTVYRLYDKSNGKAIADYITLFDEKIDETKPLTIFDPKSPWKRRMLTNFVAKPMLVKIFDKGNLVYDCPTIDEIKSYTKNQIDTLWDEVKRFENPHNYYVDLSQKLYDLKMDILNKYSKY